MRWTTKRHARRLLPYLFTLATAGAGVYAYTERAMDGVFAAPVSSAAASAPLTPAATPSAAAVERARHRLRVAIWGAMAVTFAVALGPAWCVFRRSTRRIRRLTGFSNAVSAGRPPPELWQRAEDDIGDLQTSLTTMAASLESQLRSAREETAKLEAVLNGMAEGVVVIDRAGTIRLSNQGADRLFGSAAAAPLCGRELIEISRDPDLRDLVREIAGGDGSRRLIREIVLNGGARSENLRVTATPIPPAQGGAQLFILVLHDVTELKRLEVMRRDFVANVSHELRTPLTAIRGYAETLRAGALEDPKMARKFVGVIERHSQRLSRLTEDLLTLSDLELGRAAVERVEMLLAPAVDAAIDMVRDKAERKQVEIRREVPADLPALSVDPDRIEQVLVNLIDNAVKYTPAGGRVRVSARVAEPPRTEATAALHDQGAACVWTEIRVSDTGIGIPSEDLPRLTERFYRVDKARSRELGGTGLGLAIVKHIVQAHQGVLRIESDLGEGTRVSVFLPAPERPAIADAALA